MKEQVLKNRGQPQNGIVLSNLCLAEVLHLRIQCAQKSLEKQWGAMHFKLAFSSLQNCLNCMQSRAGFLTFW